VLLEVIEHFAETLTKFQGVHRLDDSSEYQRVKTSSSPSP
jgi:hypothetical protein